MTDKDFQKELQEATRRRSMLSVPGENKSSKSTVVTQSPVLKAMSKPRPPGAEQRNAAKPPTKSKAPKPPQSPKVQQQKEEKEPNTIQLEIRTTPETNPVIEKPPPASTAEPPKSPEEVCATEKPVKSFYYGMPEQQQQQERTGNATIQVNGIHSHESAGNTNNGQVVLLVNGTTAAKLEVDETELEQDKVLERVELTAIESFAESIFAVKNKQQQQLHHHHQQQRDSSESAVSSFVEDPLVNKLLYPPPSSNNNNNTTSHHNNGKENFDDTESLEGISLQLRPTLPKKQFEIPRFSPAAAWRLLTTAETAREVVANSQLKEYENHDQHHQEIRSVASGNDSSSRNPETEVSKTPDDCFDIYLVNFISFVLLFIPVPHYSLAVAVKRK